MSEHGPRTKATVEDQVSQALLDAVVALAGDLELRDLLERIVGTARDLTGAGYAALGVMRAEWRGIKVAGHVEEVLKAVKALKKAA